MIVCDDGSVDLMGAMAEGLGAVVIRRERNRGYGASLRSLFRELLGRGYPYVLSFQLLDPGLAEVLNRLNETERELSALKLKVGVAVAE